MERLSIACATLGLNSVTQVVFAHSPEEGYQMGPCMMWWEHGMGWWIIPLIIIVVMLIFCFLFLGRRGGGRSSWCGFGEQKDAGTPLDILKKRYAKGEITKEEYDRIRKDL